MSSEKHNVPFLPGTSFRDVAKADFRKPHSLGYINGYPLQKKPVAGIGAVPLENGNNVVDIDELISKLEETKGLGYLDERAHVNQLQQGFLPAHVAFDKVVLRFDAYFKETVHESAEQFHLRIIRILYFLEDNSIAVIEPPVENSGIPQGVLIKRQRIPKSSTEYYTANDFNLGINITFYGRTFRIVSCDKFTESYMTETAGVKLNSPEPLPKDPYQEGRIRPSRSKSAVPERHGKLKRFLENDRKVLRYYCIWDDRDSMFGELREFVIHYHLVDDSVEVREIQKPNNGRDHFPILLRRQQLPKSFKELADLNETEGDKYTWRDFQIGNTISVLGRPFLIRDCDDYTKRFYAEQTGIHVEQIKSIPLPIEQKRKIEQETPPYNGFGTVEDSLGSCKYLVLSPPKKDFIKMLENEHKDSKHKEDQDRRFVISYRLADDTMTIYEPPQRNAGILGGKFMERRRVLLPGSSLSDPQGPAYYEVTDLFVGGKIQVFSHKFVLIDADEYVFHFMEADPLRFKKSDINEVKLKIERELAGLPADKKAFIREEFKTADPSRKGVLPRNTFVQILKKHVPASEHELMTFARTLETQARHTLYSRVAL